VYIHTHTTVYLCLGPQVGRYQKGETNLDFTGARNSEWQWHQLGHMQVCTSLQTDNHSSTPPLNFYGPDALPAAQPTAQSTEGNVHNNVYSVHKSMEGYQRSYISLNWPPMLIKQYYLT